jgi:hypothetical protein
MSQDREPLTKSTADDDLTPALTLLLLLISTDLVFILLHLVNVETGWLRGTGISLEDDGGLPETFQYVKEFWIVVAMAAVFWRTRARVYVSWMFLFAFLLIDDVTQLHERAGKWLGQRYSLAGGFGLRPDDAGELLFAAAVGASLLAFIGLSSWRAGEQSRRVSRDMLLVVVVLGALGVVVDMLHVIAYMQRSLFAQVLLVVEDGGEMLVMSALTAYAFNLAVYRGRTRFDLWAFLTRRRRTAPTPAP